MAKEEKFSVETLLSAQMKRDARTSLKYWLSQELNHLVAEEANVMVRQWLKTHKDEVRTQVAAEITTRLPHLIKETVDSILQRWY